MQTADIIPVSVSELSGLLRPTKLVRLNSFPDVWVKREDTHPTGSHKDRGYIGMLASRDDVASASTLVDYTTGNGGISLAWLAKCLGKDAVIFMPDGMTPQRSELIRAYDATLFTTRRDLFVRGAREAAQQFTDNNPGSVLVNQSDNPANPAAYEAAGNEMTSECKDAGIRPGAFVCGIGTGGTFSGISRALKRQYANLPCIAVEVDEAPLVWAKRSGASITPRLPSIIGFGAGAVAVNTDESLINDVDVVSLDRVVPVLNKLRESDGLSVGPSTAANILIASECAARLRAPVLTLAFDKGNRYG